MTAVELRCTNCGAANPPGSRFCSSCGASLEDVAPPQEERKLVSVLFVDLVGSTARADKADPEDVRDVLQIYHGEAKQCIEQYGGVLEKFIGDAVMAVFGAPVAHGDDAERAVRAGLRVLEGIQRVNADHELDLAARAAVNTGDALVSVEHARTGGALATGDVINTASRLQNAAPSGRVIVGAETYRATRHAIRYEEVDAIDAKGKADALEAWLAVEASTAPAERPLAATPLVGRERELELLGSVWARAVEERRPHLVTLVGPPGIGKSRLCREVHALVSASDGRILRGRCLPYEEKAGYPAFARIVHDAGGILESDQSSVARAKLEAIVGDVLPPEEARDTYRYLSLLLGLAADEEARSRAFLFFAARRLIECLALRQPTVFVFEDVHWADGSELELLTYLAQHVRDAPALLIATARPELLDAQPTWGAGLAAQTTIPLEPLAGRAAQVLAETLIESVGGSRAVDPARLVDVAGGNPLFLEELAASVAELGDSGDLPVTVREAIAARIDATPLAVRDALLSAAVIGRTFWRGVLAAVGGIEDVDEVLHVLEARDFVRRDTSSQLAGDVQYTFKHMLIREVAYATVPRAARRERHAAVGKYVEDELAGESLSSILAYHWREADEPARAVPYLLAAAHAARRSWAKAAAVDLYTKALDLEGDAGAKRRTRLERAQALVELQDYDAAATEFDALLPDLDGAEKLEALIWRGLATVWSERDADTIATAEQALALANEVGEQSSTAAAIALMSQGLAMRGAEGDLDEADELGDRALELWVTGSRPYELANHLHLHADTKYWIGQYAQSVELSREARRVATDVQSPEGLLRGGGFEALALAGLGRHDEAIAIWDEMLKIAGELGHNPSGVLNYSALAYRELYDLDEARRRSEHVLELTAGMKFGMPRQFAGSDLIQTHLLAGDVGTAEADWAQRWEDARQATAWTTWLVAGRLAAARAEIALEHGSPELAAEWAERSLKLARRTRRRKYEAISLRTYGEALVRLRRGEDALEALRSAVQIADDLVGRPGRWDVRAALGRVAYALGKDDEAAQAYREAAALVDEFTAQLAPERATTLAKSPVIAEIRSA
jgi:class 3 adenylate cyclase/tetratricopeptide (TPR) repeat protein